MALHQGIRVRRVQISRRLLGKELAPMPDNAKGGAAEYFHSAAGLQHCHLFSPVKAQAETFRLFFSMAKKKLHLLS